jgi:hypothetical protein
MSAFAGMTLTFLSHPLIFNDSGDEAVYLERLELDGRRVAVVTPGAYSVAVFAMYHNFVKVHRLCACRPRWPLPA